MKGNGMTRNKSLAWMVLLMLFLASCASQKKVYKEPIKHEGDAFLISKMQENQSQFNTLKAKALIKLTNGNKTSDLNVNIRIKKDSIVWVSISAGIGLEAARVVLTKDSVVFINRLEKTFFAGNYHFINQMINAQVDFDIIQALLTGNDFKWYDYHDLKAKVVNNSYHLESTHRHKLKKYIRKSDTLSQAIYQCMWLNPESFKIEKIKIKEIKNENKKISAEYSKFKTINDQVLPTQYDIIISANSDIIIDATLIKININDPLSFPINIPSKYKEIEMK